MGIQIGDILSEDRNKSQNQVEFGQVACFSALTAGINWFEHSGE